MAPSKYDKIRSLFRFNEKKKESVCLLTNCYEEEIEKTRAEAIKKNVEAAVEEDEAKRCKKVLLGSKVSNLRSHLKSKHKTVYKLLQKHQLFNEHSSHFKQKEKSPVDGFQSKLTNHFSLEKRTVTIPIHKISLIRALLATVTVDGRPFCAVEDVGFSMFAQPAMKTFNIHYNRKNIGDLVDEAAEFIKMSLKKDFENSLVCVKVDCATRLNRSFLGMNVQLIKDGKIVVYTLAVKEIKVQHTAENLRELILKELESYGIFPKNIYTITSDNGANLVKAIQLIETQQLEDETNKEENEDDFEASNELAGIISNVKWDADRIMSIRCAAHVLQLCIADTLKNSWEDDETEYPVDSYLSAIKEARNIVKQLRTQNVMLLLNEQNLKKPPLDVKTRWGSTYLMLTSLVDLKDFCATCVNYGNKKLKLPDETWKKIEEICVCLEPSYRAMKKLQYRDITLTDIYKVWYLCHIQTAEIGSPFSSELIYNMIKRRDALMENNVMLGAMYLDPRFSFELSKDQKETAINHIQSIHDRIDELKQEREVLLSSEDTDAMVTEAEDEEARIEKSLRAKHRYQKRQSTHKPSFQSALKSFSDLERLNSKTDILSFWKTNEHLYSLLSEVAYVILSVPGTQVSVEQLFSQLRFILSDLRWALTPEHLNNILIVRCNFSLLEKFFEKF